ncbi:biotin-dependent carboxyltransferase family protein [Algibacter sp. 2305UL17-15]|uniref:5-oxoprolinase subunit C family protein n=1 Tax=Algibacter sp. 2305UL17-15 TaxID=3231268 RepID=UPI00345AA5EC
MIRVLKPGFYTTVRDLGRMGWQQFGVPVSGAMDMRALKVANSLLGNKTEAAVLEMTMSGPKLEILESTAICISGGHMSPKLNDSTIKNDSLIEVSKGDILSFGKLVSGFRSYLAVSGGFITESVMGSRSMYPRITEQIQIKKGDELKISKNNISNKKKFSSVKIDTDYLKSNVIEVFKGPEFHQLSKAQKERLFSKDFSISKENNRMAYQLKETLDNALPSIITSLVMPGTVQLTPSGKLIILMRDCQTTGGYPRVLQLSEQAIDVLAQKFIGNSVCFKLK